MATTKVQSELIADDVALAGNPTTSTQSAGNNTTRIAPTAFVTTAVNNLIDSAPGTMDTLNEIAAALGDDPSFTTTVNNAIALKAPLANPTFTGTATAPAVNISAGTPVLTLTDTSSSATTTITLDGVNTTIDSNGTDGDIIFKGQDSSSEITALTLDMSDAGSAYFNNKVGIGTTAPQGNLHIEGAAGASGGGILYITDADNGSTSGDALQISKSGDTAFVYNRESSGNLQLGAGNDATHLVILSGGNVGIGTTSPSNILHLRSATPQMYMQSDDGNDVSIIFGDASDASRGQIKYTSSDDMLFLNNNLSERMRIKSDGKVGIGTTSPGAVLEVVGPAARPTSLAELDTASTAKFTSDSSNNDSLYIAEGDSGALIQVNDGASNSSTAKDLQIQPFGGNVGIGTDSPSYPLSVELDASATWLSRFYNTGTTESDNGLLVRTGSEHDGTITLGAYSGSSYKFVVLGDGNVGIGTTSPSGMLDVHTVDTSAYSSTGEPVETALIHNESGSDGTGATYYSSLALTVGDGATSQGFINYIRTADNQGSFAFSQRTGSSSYAEAMRIASDGKVGIGTTSPVNDLHLAGAASTAVYLKITNATTGNTAGDGSAIGIDADGDLIIHNAEAKDAKFYTNDNERMRIDSSGDLLVGTTSTASNSLLHVAGGIRFNPFSAGHGLNVVSYQSFNNTDVANACGSVYYKCFLVNIYHNNGHTQFFGIANGGGGVGYNFTILRPDTSSQAHGQGISFSTTTIGSSPNTFNFVISSGGGALSIERTSGTGSFAVSVHNIAGG